MASIEVELKKIKIVYGDYMTQEHRKKYDRYVSISKDFSKLESEPSYICWKNNTILKSLKKNIKNFRRCIQNNYKYQCSDFQAFKWKLNKQGKQNDIPKCFQLLKIIPQTQKRIQLTDLQNINFPVLSYRQTKLIHFGTMILSASDYFRKNFDFLMLEDLVKTMSSQYNVVSYHNFSHAFSVQMQLFQCIKRSSQLNKVYDNFQIGFTYLAALAHDLNHNGTNSAYEIHKKSDLAREYNNESVLENMHVSYFFKILRENPALDILAKIKSIQDRERAKRLIVKLILATDISKHFTNVNLLKQKICYTNDSLNKMDISERQNKQLILQNLFHACDIGNSCLDFDNYITWASLLSYQFHQQTQIQLKENLQVTEFLKFKDMKNFFTGQIGFINTFVLPLWKTLSIFWPQLKQFEENIHKNKTQLQRRIQDY